MLENYFECDLKKKRKETLIRKSKKILSTQLNNFSTYNRENRDRLLKLRSWDTRAGTKSGRSRKIWSSSFGLIVQFICFIQLRSRRQNFVSIGESSSWFVWHDYKFQWSQHRSTRRKQVWERVMLRRETCHVQFDPVILINPRVNSTMILLHSALWYPKRETIAFHCRSVFVLIILIERWKICDIQV